MSPSRATPREQAPDAPNPAVVPEPEPHGERTYEVTGPHHAVLGHGCGEKFKALIPPDQEALLIESGHIKRVEPRE